MYVVNPYINRQRKEAADEFPTDARLRTVVGGGGDATRSGRVSFMNFPILNALFTSEMWQQPMRLFSTPR